MNVNFRSHSKTGLVVQIVAYTVLTVVCLVLGVVEHNRHYLFVMAFLGVGGIVTSTILLRSKRRSNGTDAGS